MIQQIGIRLDTMLGVGNGCIADTDSSQILVMCRRTELFDAILVNEVLGSIGQSEFIKSCQSTADCKGFCSFHALPGFTVEIGALIGKILSAVGADIIKSILCIYHAFQRFFQKISIKNIGHKLTSRYRIGIVIHPFDPVVIQVQVNPVLVHKLRHSHHRRSHKF